MLTFRPKAGVSRDQIVAQLTGRMSPGAWELVRRGVLSHVLYKTDGEPAVFALLTAPSEIEARKTLDGRMEHPELFDVEVVPVNQFPHFD